MATYEPFESQKITEEAGIVTGAERTFLVTIPVTGMAGDLFSLASVQTNVPQPGDALSTAWPYVRCRRRTAEIVSTDGAVAAVRIACTYEYEEPNPTYALRGGSTCTQIETNYTSPGSTTRITISYNSTTVTGTITPLVPQQSLSLEASIATRYPDTYVDLYVGRVNLSAWRGGDAKEWLCTAANYELRNKTSDPPVYHFAFSFERKVGGWIYYVAYKSPDGSIPNDNAAITSVDYHGVSEFKDLFGS
jgi:hypothetical protein